MASFKTFANQRDRLAGETCAIFPCAGKFEQLLDHLAQLLRYAAKSIPEILLDLTAFLNDSALQIVRRLPLE